MSVSIGGSALEHEGFYNVYVGVQGVVRQESACYELHKIDIEVGNPFKKEGEFRHQTRINSEYLNNLYVCP